jgi:hypothetical protein
MATLLCGQQHKMLFAASKFESEQIEFYGTNKLEFADMQIQINGDKANKRCRQKQRMYIQSLEPGGAQAFSQMAKEGYQ